MIFPEKGVVVPVGELTKICGQHGMIDVIDIIRSQPPELPFKSDGASGFPDQIGEVNIYPAAFLHDIGYWCGIPGDDEMRFLRDIEFSKRVVFMCGGTPSLAMMLLNGVRAGGLEWLPTTWRWAFGRKI